MPTLCLGMIISGFAHFPFLVRSPQLLKTSVMQTDKTDSQTDSEVNRSRSAAVFNLTSTVNI